jgi:adenylate cyclase
MIESDRRLAAIMFTDIVGYTRLAQANESRALELLEEHRKILRPLFPTHGGSEVKTIGDAFLVEFRSALEAVLCAVEIQKKIAERNSSGNPAGRLDVRVGIHLGDVVHGSGDVAGDAVNVASRIEPLAEPGGICISQQVYDHVRNKTDLDFQKMGEVELKNVELPVGVYKVTMSRTGRDVGHQSPRERLAVLPFVNISPDPNDEYFADGLTEELISKLSEVKGLKVIARTSVMNYKKKEKNVTEIGRELGVGSIIEGSVRKAGDKVRVSVQLIDSNNQEHLWASNYDRKLDDIFAIQSDVASSVASSLSKGVFAVPQRQDTDSVEAYTLFIRAQQLYHEGTETSLRDALSLLEQVVAIDPGFVRAHASMAHVWCRLAANGFEDWSIIILKAEVAARKALSLGPDWAEPHAALSQIGFLMDRFDESIAESEAAIKINPNIPEAHFSLAAIYSSMGDLGRGLDEMGKAYELDPLSVSTSIFFGLMSWVAGKQVESFAILEKLRNLNPRHPRVYSALAEWYMQKQDFLKAQEMLDSARAFGHDEPLTWLDQGVLYAYTGRKEEALAIIRNASTYKSQAARLYAQLFINAALGNLDAAFEALMKAAELHSWPFLIRFLPAFVELRKDPRYLEFLKRVGLSP